MCIIKSTRRVYIPVSLMCPQWMHRLFQDKTISSLLFWTYEQEHVSFNACAPLAKNRAMEGARGTGGETRSCFLRKLLLFRETWKQIDFGSSLLPKDVWFLM